MHMTCHVTNSVAYADSAAISCLTWLFAGRQVELMLHGIHEDDKTSMGVLEAF